MNSTIQLGILGGGQLGSMLIKSAIDFGINVAVMDKNENAPAGKYTNLFTCADPLNYDDVVKFGKQCDIITIEKEAVNTDALTYLRDSGKQVYPSPELIAIVQDKHMQKEFMLKHDIAVVPSILIDNKAELKLHSSKLPGCLKLRRNGYDGKGVMMIHTEKDIENAFDDPCILEEKVNIKQEISVIVSRNVSGGVACYDAVAMVFNNEKHLLDYQICPADISEELKTKAYNTAIKIANELELVGILAIEMFVTSDDKLLVNELAPRPHNSGHHTIEGCASSQYEQHLRAIMNYPPGDTRLLFNAVGMINVIENGNSGDFTKIWGRPNAHMHYYGKVNSKPGRKIGHVTITGHTTENLIEDIATLKSILN